jgi:hypothetical protein
MNIDNNKLSGFRLYGIKRIKVKQGFFGYFFDVEFFEKCPMTRNELIRNLSEEETDE